MARANRALAHLKARNNHFMFKENIETVYIKPSSSEQPPSATGAIPRFQPTPNSSSDHSSSSDLTPTAPPDASYVSGHSITYYVLGNSRRYKSLRTFIQLPHAYTVPIRSDLNINGISSRTLAGATTTSGLLIAAYGGIHLAAWNASFATPVEMWIWRASTLTIVALPVSSVTLYLETKTQELVNIVSDHLTPTLEPFESGVGSASPRRESSGVNNDRGAPHGLRHF